MLMLDTIYLVIQIINWIVYMHHLDAYQTWCITGSPPVTIWQATSCNWCCQKTPTCKSSPTWSTRAFSAPSKPGVSRCVDGRLKATKCFKKWVVSKKNGSELWCSILQLGWLHWQFDPKPYLFGETKDQWLCFYFRMVDESNPFGGLWNGWVSLSERQMTLGALRKRLKALLAAWRIGGRGGILTKKHHRKWEKKSAGPWLGYSGPATAITTFLEEAPSLRKPRDDEWALGAWFSEWIDRENWTKQLLWVLIFSSILAVLTFKTALRSNRMKCHIRCFSKAQVPKVQPPVGCLSIERFPTWDTQHICSVWFSKSWGSDTTVFEEHSCFHCYTFPLKPFQSNKKHILDMKCLQKNWAFWKPVSLSMSYAESCGNSQGNSWVTLSFFCSDLKVWPGDRWSFRNGKTSQIGWINIPKNAPSMAKLPTFGSFYGSMWVNLPWSLGDGTWIESNNIKSRMFQFRSWWRPEKITKWSDTEESHPKLTNAGWKFNRVGELVWRWPKCVEFQRVQQ